MVGLVVVPVLRIPYATYIAEEVTVRIGFVMYVLENRRTIQGARPAACAPDGRLGQVLGPTCMLTGVVHVLLRSTVGVRVCVLCIPRPVPRPRRVE